MTIDELRALACQIHPYIAIETDNEGQVVLYTGLYLHEDDDNLHNEPQEQE